MGLSGFGDDVTLDEGIKEVKVGPKKKVSSSGWAVNSKRRGEEPSLAGPDGKISLECSGWSRPRKTGSKASATYRAGMSIMVCPTLANLRGCLCLCLLAPYAHTHSQATCHSWCLMPCIPSAPFSLVFSLTAHQLPLSTFSVATTKALASRKHLHVS